MISECGWFGVVLAFLWVRFGVLSECWVWSGFVVFVDLMGLFRATGVGVFPVEVGFFFGEGWVCWVWVFRCVLISLSRRRMDFRLVCVVTWFEPWLS